MTQRATLCGRIMLVPPLLRFCPYRPQSFLTRIDAIVGCRDAPHRCRAVNAAVQTLLRRLNTAAEHFLANRSYADGRPFTTATSLLTITAGLVLRISPPIEGSKATHHTSPRRGGLSGLIGNIAGQVLHPLRGFALTFFVGGHRPIAFYDLLRDHVRPRKIVEESADPSSADNAM